MRHMLTTMSMCVATGAFVCATYGWDVHVPNMPDVEKPDPLDANDKSCWLAAAANQLAGAGWNSRDANGIYGDLLTHYTKLNGGWCAQAAQWWLTNYGTDKKSSKYDPDNKYTDIKVHNAVGLNPQGSRSNDWSGEGASQTDMDNLLNEIWSWNNNFVNIGMSPSLSGGGHCVTLVGGDFHRNHEPYGQTVWHDSEGDLSNPPGDDDAYNMVGTGIWRTYYNAEWECYYASVLRRGPNWVPPTPDASYDLTWYADWTGTSLLNQWHISDGDQPYLEPSWINDQMIRLLRPDGALLRPFLDIYLSVDFSLTQATDPQILVLDPNGTPAELISLDWNDDRGKAMWHYRFAGYHPAWTTIAFPGTDYHDLESNVMNWRVSAIPEPATVMLLALGGFAAVARRRRQRCKARG